MTASGQRAAFSAMLHDGSRHSLVSRRTFVAALTGGALAAPVAGWAQQGKVPRIGWLGGPSRETAQPFVQPFLQGLKDLGWIEGQNIAIEWRFAGGRAERLPELAAELVRLRVDLIVVPSTPTALAAKNAPSTIPLVSAGGDDPVALGLVASLARPGGNITGLTSRAPSPPTCRSSGPPRSSWSSTRRPPRRSG